MRAFYVRNKFVQLGDTSFGILNLNDASLGILKLGEASLEIFELGEMGFSLWSWNFEVSWDELGMLY